MVYLTALLSPAESHQMVG